MTNQLHIGAIQVLNKSIANARVEIQTREKRIIKLKEEIRDLQTTETALQATIVELEKPDVV